MARNFNGTNQYLERTVAISSDAPVAISAWVRASALGTDMWVAGSANSGIGFNQQLRIGINASGFPYLYTHSGGSQIVTVTSGGTVSVGTWAHVAGIFASTTDRRVLLNNGSKATSATSAGDGSGAGYNRTGVSGLFSNNVRSGYFAGDIAEVAFYSLSGYSGATNALRADTWETKILPALAAGVSPRLFRLGLTAYWPLTGRPSPETDVINGNNLTVTGATTADHPRVYQPIRRPVVYMSMVTNLPTQLFGTGVPNLRQWIPQRRR